MGPWADTAKHKKQESEHTLKIKKPGDAAFLRSVQLTASECACMSTYWRVSSWHCDAHKALLSWYHSLPAALIGMWINNIIVPADCRGFGYWGREMLLDSSRYYTTIKETKLYKSFGAWGERQQNWIRQANLKLAKVFSYHSLTQLLYIFFSLTSEHPIEAVHRDFYKNNWECMQGRIRQIHGNIQ